MIELMITVSVIMMGAVLLQGSYMRSMDVFGRYTHSLQSMIWMGEKMSMARESILSSDGFSPSESGSLSDGGKSLDWSQTIRPASGTNLYSVQLSMQWNEGGKPMLIESEQYVYKPDPSQAL